MNVQWHPSSWQHPIRCGNTNCGGLQISNQWRYEYRNNDQVPSVLIINVDDNPIERLVGSVIEGEVVQWTCNEDTTTKPSKWGGKCHVGGPREEAGSGTPNDERAPPPASSSATMSLISFHMAYRKRENNRPQK